MEYLETTLRLLSYISAICVTIAAFWGLKQLTIAKETARTNAKRDSYKLAAEQCKFYLQEVIPIQISLDKKSKEIRKDFEENSKVTREKDAFSCEFSAKIDFDALDFILEEFAYTFNAMESFSAFFISGVAEERVGFLTVGKTFCNHVESYLPILLMFRSGEEAWKNLMSLYIMWSDRFTSVDLNKQKEDLEKQIQKTENKTIRPIGI